MVRAPDQASAHIAHPVATVNVSTPWEFHCPIGREATLVASTPGCHVVDLQSELVFDDDLYPGLRGDRQTIDIVVEGAALGCHAMLPAGTVPGVGVLAWVALGLRRRRCPRAVARNPASRALPAPGPV